MIPRPFEITTSRRPFPEMFAQSSRVCMFRLIERIKTARVILAGRWTLRRELVSLKLVCHWETFSLLQAFVAFTFPIVSVLLRRFHVSRMNIIYYLFIICCYTFISFISYILYNKLLSIHEYYIFYYYISILIILYNYIT